MFRVGDFIRVKENTKLETGEIVNNWAGEVTGVFNKEKICLISFDAETIDSLDDAFLRSCIELDEEPYEYIFRFSDLELSNRRNSDEEIMASIDRLVERMLVLEEAFEEEQSERNQVWIKEFEQSDFFETLDKDQKENAGFIVDTFLTYMFDYESVPFEEWTTYNIEYVCLELVPQKITSEIELFEDYGVVLIQFLHFLGSKNHLSNSKALIQTVEQIKNQIVVEAKNPENWGMAKSMMMSAQEQGFDLSSEEDIEKFIMHQQLKSVEQDNAESAKIIPLRPDPFKGIGRNQKITVKYNNGKMLTDIKFKKVESDLRNGKCQIVNK